MWIVLVTIIVSWIWPALMNTRPIQHFCLDSGVMRLCVCVQTLLNMCVTYKMKMKTKCLSVSFQWKNSLVMRERERESVFLYYCSWFSCVFCRLWKEHQIPQDVSHQVNVMMNYIWNITHNHHQSWGTDRHYSHSLFNWVFSVSLIIHLHNKCRVIPAPMCLILVLCSY